MWNGCCYFGVMMVVIVGCDLVEVVFICVVVCGVGVVDCEFLFGDCVFEVDCCIVEVWNVYVVDDDFDVVEVDCFVVFEELFVEVELVDEVGVFFGLYGDVQLQVVVVFLFEEVFDFGGCGVGQGDVVCVGGFYGEGCVVYVVFCDGLQVYGFLVDFIVVDIVGFRGLCCLFV